jgi:hypothetical protein
MLGYCFDCKKHTIQMIRLAAKTKSDANSLRELVITDLLEKTAPSSAALSFIKKQVSELF